MWEKAKPYLKIAGTMLVVLAAVAAFAPESIKQRLRV